VIKLNQKRKKQKMNCTKGRDSRQQRRSNKNGQFDGQSVRWRRKTMVAEQRGGTGNADFLR